MTINEIHIVDLRTTMQANPVFYLVNNSIPESIRLARAR